MLNKTHGWALSDTSVLKTSDGGNHWNDVTPANGGISKGFFLNDQDAWGVSFPTQQNAGLPAGNLVNILRTTDGGKSWQSSTIQSETVTDAYPFFLNASDGWLQTFGQLGMGDQPPSAIFHTTDGGQQWKFLGNTYPSEPSDCEAPAPSGPPCNPLIHSSGISFSDAQNGCESGLGGAGTTEARPVLDVTHDGGQTWHSLSLPALPGAGNIGMIPTTPPVFFGKNGLLPVSVRDIGFDLYVTHDGGQTWTPTKLVTRNGQSSFTVYVADMQHAWATSGTDLYATSDGGQSWTNLPPTPLPISTLDFADANNGWAITPANLLYTTDGGSTWQPINYSIVPPQKG